MREAIQAKTSLFALREVIITWEIQGKSRAEQEAIYDHYMKTFQGIWESAKAKWLNDKTVALEYTYSFHNWLKGHDERIANTWYQMWSLEAPMVILEGQ